MALIIRFFNRFLCLALLLILGLSFNFLLGYKNYAKTKKLSRVTLSSKKSAKNSKAKDNNDQNLKTVIESSKRNQKKTIDAINFIQPSLSLTAKEKDQLDQVLSRAEQEQLIILWRATLERNKTIHFIVQKLSPESNLSKKNTVLSRVLNTAIFLPFYALQAVTPTDTTALASYFAAGITGDLVSAKSKKEKNKLQLSQTEMVIMFMMIDGVAERVREQYKDYKQSQIDLLLLDQELEEAKREASLSLDLSSPESRFLSQIRIRQIERELRRADWTFRSNKISLVDLCGLEAVKKVNQLISKEVSVTSEQPLF